MEPIVLIIFIIAVALIFDFINGFHDAANSIATVVSTRVLSPTQAVVWAAFFNFVAAFGFGVSVAPHDRQGHRASGDRGRARDPGRPRRRHHLEPDHVVRGDSVQLLACADRRLRRRRGGQGRLRRASCLAGLVKTALFIVLAPLIGLALGFALMVAVMLRLPPRVARAAWTGSSGGSSSCRPPFYSLGHGTNDAQKTMGIIAVLLFATGHLGPEFYVPVLGGPGGSRGDGARDAGRGLADRQDDGHGHHQAAAGRRLLRRDGRGADARSAPPWAGFRSARPTRSRRDHRRRGRERLSAVRWGMAGRIVWAWILTIPASALIAGASSALLGWLR